MRSCCRPLRSTMSAGSSPTRSTASRSARGPWRSWCTKRPAAIRSSRSSSFSRWPTRGWWHWNIDRIGAKSYADNVVDLMAGKLKRLSATTQEALKQLACLGNVAEITTLTLVHGETEEATHAALWEAVSAGLIVHQDNDYRFLHDRIQ